MRRKISLYIADRLVDLSEDSLVLMNYTFEDLSNPTIVKNSYSKSIALEGTPNNNEIFGEFWRLDRTTDYGTGAEFSGIYFDATRKTPFKIYDEQSNILVSGYCKLDRVEKEGNAYKYSISLYGGLGSFFYKLSYNDDGSKKTLLDLTFKDMEGTSVPGDEINIGFGWGVISSAWNYIQNPETFQPMARNDLYYNIINFAPCYNGLPENFDADKMICNPLLFKNVKDEVTIDGDLYSTKIDAKNLLVSFEHPLTEWEICDLRWYLQRPVISMKAIVDAIVSSSAELGYEIVTDGGFFNDSNPYYAKVWITMPMISVDDRNNPDFLKGILSSSLTPADYLIEYCKMFGLVMVSDNTGKKITIMRRRDFFLENAEICDLSDKIDKSAVSITPNVADHRYYEMGGGKAVLGEWAKNYKVDFRREYGIQRINTGYDFDQETTQLTKEFKTQEAVDVQEFSKYYFTDGTLGQDGISIHTLFLPRLMRVTAQYWSRQTGHFDKSAEMDINITEGLPVYDNEDKNGYDWLPKMQLHDEDNKAIEGENIFVMYEGVRRQLIEGKTPFYKYYMITNDHPDMVKLNNGKACWNLSVLKSTAPNAMSVIPSFKRAIGDKTGTGYNLTASLEFGEPFARAVFGVKNPDKVSLYNLFWKDYLADRYDTDTKVMRCKVNMKGMQVGQPMLGRFYWYGGALWVLNKIENYSLTTDDLVECEFIKVKDKTNYTK